MIIVVENRPERAKRLETMKKLAVVDDWSAVYVGEDGKLGLPEYYGPKENPDIAGVIRASWAKSLAELEALRYTGEILLIMGLCGNTGCAEMFAVEPNEVKSLETLKDLGLPEFVDEDTEKSGLEALKTLGFWGDESGEYAITLTTMEAILACFRNTL